MKKLWKKDKQKISYSFIFSIALHFFFFAFAVYKITPPQYKSNLAFNSAKSKSIKLDEIKFINREELKKIKDNQTKQIVANETNGKNERPINSRFAGEKDQVFDRQTMAKLNGAFKEAGLGTKAGSSIALDKKEALSKPVRKNNPREAKKPLSLSDLGGFKIADVTQHEKELEASFEDATKKLAAEKQLGALGAQSGKAGVNGLAQNSDFVEDVPLGDMTNLNTTEFKYYGFYHRIRQKLEQHWGSSIRDKAKNLYRSGRRMPASDNLITSVTVVLNDLGQIVDMKIEGTSGVRELDQAAIESFNKAGPFPNPPKGLLVGGRATIQWGFVVKS